MSAACEDDSTSDPSDNPMNDSVAPPTQTDIGLTQKAGPIPDEEHPKHIELGDQAFYGERVMTLYLTAHGFVLSLWSLPQFERFATKARAKMHGSQEWTNFVRLVVGYAIQVGSDNVLTRSLEIPPQMNRHVSAESRILRFDVDDGQKPERQCSMQKR